jgi:hypothetical protein
MKLITLDSEQVLSLYKPLELVFLGLGLLTVFNFKIYIHAKKSFKNYICLHIT